MPFQQLPDEELHGAEEITDFLSHLFFPSRLTVTGLGDHLHLVPRVPTMQIASLRMRTLSAASIHVDLPIRVDVDAVSGPLLIVPVGYGTDPRTVTSPATPAARSEATVATTGTRQDRALPGHYVFTLVAMSQTELEREAIAIVGGPPARPVRFDPVVDLTSETGLRLEAALQLLRDQIREQSPLLGSDVAERHLEQMVLDMFLLAADHIEAEVFDVDGTTISTPWVRRAVELIENRPEQPWTVPELSQEVVVSARALYEGFRRELDTTPMGYLQGVRLIRARELLARREGGTTVAMVASRYGLGHLGRFASAYRERFGETPSQTLRGTQDTVVVAAGAPDGSGGAERP